jgi:phospholysine phosphohistidine inorganic pyrophosphate phosphatase
VVERAGVGTMRGILIDIDGVIYQGDAALPGSADTVAWLQASDIPHLFVTNTTSRPRSAVAAKLQGMGVPVAEDSILTPVVAARHWLAAHGCRAVGLFVPEATRADFGPVPALAADTAQGADAVVIGDLGQGWDFATLNRAFRLLMAAEDVALIALGMTRYWRAEDGLRLDVAPFVAALQTASGREPVVLGKPSEDFFGQAAERLGLRFGELAMIGDDIRVDVGGAQAVGMTGIQVRTGKFGAADLDGPVSPDAVLDSFADLPAWWRAEAS